MFCQERGGVEMDVIFRISFSFVIAIFAHELGHLLAGRAVGLRTRLGIVWREVFGIRYPNPCVKFEGEATVRQLRVFGVGGFGTEFATLAGLVIARWLGVPYIECASIVIYAVIATAHLISYPFRNAGRDDNDFRWLC